MVYGGGGLLSGMEQAWMDIFQGFMAPGRASATKKNDGRAALVGNWYPTWQPNVSNVVPHISGIRNPPDAAYSASDPDAWVMPPHRSAYPENIYNIRWFSKQWQARSFLLVMSFVSMVTFVSFAAAQFAIAGKRIDMRVVWYEDHATSFAYPHYATAVKELANFNMGYAIAAYTSIAGVGMLAYTFFYDRWWYDMQYGHLSLFHIVDWARNGWAAVIVAQLLGLQMVTTNALLFFVFAYENLVEWLGDFVRNDLEWTAMSPSAAPPHSINAVVRAPWGVAKGPLFFWVGARPSIIGFIILGYAAVRGQLDAGYEWFVWAALGLFVASRLANKVIVYMDNYGYTNKPTAVAIYIAYLIIDVTAFSWVVFVGSALR
jgi:hypothetical protein